MKYEQTFHIRPGYPDFVDLPWEFPLENWHRVCDSLVQVERGLSRHTVVFVNYSKKIYAIKELPGKDLAEKEYENLRLLEKKNMPCVEAVGYALFYRPEAEEKEVSVLITVYLDLSLPYRALFIKQGMERYRDRLLDSMACLLVRLHLAGVYWGDCSLSNILFRREGGELGAYVVDVETSSIYEQVSDGQREQDLMIMRENVYGDLTDLSFEYPALTEVSLEDLSQSIIDRYNKLWDEINKEVFISKEERYKIQERIKTLNQMGFSVDEVELINFGDQEKLKMRAIVTDQSYHRHTLHSLTGIVAKDNESRLMINDINELKATLSKKMNRSLPMSVAASHWLNNVYYPTIEKLKEAKKEHEDTPGLYCQLLEHKWYLSEKAGRDVGLDLSSEDFVQKLKQQPNQDSPLIPPAQDLYLHPSLPENTEETSEDNEK